MYFGDVVDGRMELSEIGEWAVKQIEQTAIIRQNDVEIPMFVVMPNHVHLIVVYNRVVPCRDASNASESNVSVLNAFASNASESNASESNASESNASESNVSACRDTSNVSASNVSTILHKTNESETRGGMDARGKTDARGASLRFGPQSGNLASLVRGIKSAVSKYANEHDIPFAWQSRYHDHIIRNQLEMNCIANYIQNNPMKWELDRFYKKTVIYSNGCHDVTALQPRGKICRRSVGLSYHGSRMMVVPRQPILLRIYRNTILSHMY